MSTASTPCQRGGTICVYAGPGADPICTAALCKSTSELLDDRIYRLVQARFPDFVQPRLPGEIAAIFVPGGDVSLMVGSEGKLNECLRDIQDLFLESLLPPAYFGAGAGGILACQSLSRSFADEETEEIWYGVDTTWPKKGLGLIPCEALAPLYPLGDSPLFPVSVQNAIHTIDEGSGILHALDFNGALHPASPIILPALACPGFFRMGKPHTFPLTNFAVPPFATYPRKEWIARSWSVADPYPCAQVYEALHYTSPYKGYARMVITGAHYELSASWVRHPSFYPGISRQQRESVVQQIETFDAQRKICLRGFMQSLGLVCKPESSS